MLYSEFRYRNDLPFDVLGPAVFKLQWWVPVDDPDDEEPTYHKAAALKRVIQ